MAGPWEAYAAPESALAAPSADGPWSQYAEPKKAFGLGDTWPAQLAKALYSGATLPGDVYTGKTAVDPSNPEFIGRTLDFATMATPMAPRSASTLAAPAGIPTADELKAASGSLYEQARNSPLSIEPGAVKNMAGGIQSALEEKGVLREFAPDTHAVLDKIQSAPAGAVATGGNLISAREALRLASQNFNNPREALAANRAIQGLDEFIKAPPAQSVLAGDPAAFAKLAEDARGNYAASKRSELVNGQVDVAEGNAAAANSGQNIGNSLRQRFNAVLKSDKKSSGFNDAELTQMQKVRDGTFLGNAGRKAGNILGGGGGLGSVASAAVGAGALGPVGAAAPILGYALKKMSDAAIRREISKLDEMTRARAPLAQGTGLAPADTFKQELLVRGLLAEEVRRRR